MSSGNTTITLVGYLLYMLTIMYSYRFGWKRFNWYAIISFTLLLGLRGNGIDYGVYNYAFQLLCSNNADFLSDAYLNTLKYAPVHFEIGHLACIKLISCFSDNSIFFFGALAFVQIFFFDMFVRNFESKRLRSLLVFFFFTTLIFCVAFNGMRQIAAFLMFINTYKFIEQRRMKKYFACVLAISMVHSSILILLPFYFFIYKDFLPRKKMQCAIYLVVMFFANFFKDRLRSVHYILNYASDEGYAGYFQREIFDLKEDVSLLVIVTRLLTFFFILMYSDKLKKKYGALGVIIYNFTFIGLLLQELSFNLAILRLNYYFYYVIFAVLALISYENLYEKKSSMATKMSTYGMVVLNIAWFANCVLKGASGCAPYILSRYL